MEVLADGNPQTLHYLCTSVTYPEAELLLKRCIEKRTVDLAICAFTGAQLPWSQTKRRELKANQALGEACGGVDIDQCRKEFGSSLEVVCRECEWEEDHGIS